MLARRSTITLTMDRYTHLLWEDLGEAVSRLPDVSQPLADESQATGTDGRNDPASSVALCVAQTEPESRSTVRLCAGDGDNETNPSGKGNSQESSGKCDPLLEKMAEVHGNRTTAESTGETANLLESGAESGALGKDLSHFDADLRAVIEAWPGLPDDVKAEIVAKVRAAQ